MKKKFNFNFQIPKETRLSLQDLSNYEGGIEGNIEILCGEYRFSYLSDDDDLFFGGYWLENWFFYFLEMIKTLDPKSNYYGFTDPESSKTAFEFQYLSPKVIKFSVLKSKSSALRGGAFKERPNIEDLDIEFSTTLIYNELIEEITNKSIDLKNQLISINKKLLNKDHILEIFNLLPQSN